MKLNIKTAAALFIAALAIVCIFFTALNKTAPVEKNTDVDNADKIASLGNVVVEKHSVRYIANTNDVIRTDETLADIIAESLASAIEKTSEGVRQIDGGWTIVPRTYIVYKEIRVNSDSPEIAEFVQIADEDRRRSGGAIREDWTFIVEVKGEEIIVKYLYFDEFSGKEYPAASIIMDAVTKEIKWRVLH